MDALARCRCAECEKLDRLPVRRHGIPGAWQTTFAGLSYGSGRCGDSRPAEPHRPALTPDSLPLFAGALEPTLF